MGQDKDFSNIFEAAQKMKKQPDAQKEQQPIAFPAALEKSEDEDLEEQFARCKGYHQSLKKEIEASYEEQGISPEDIRRYLDTPTNFAERDWKMIEKTRKELEQKLRAMIDKENPPGDSSSPGDQPLPDKPKPARPKGGFIGKKNWISMH